MYAACVRIANPRFSGMLIHTRLLACSQPQAAVTPFGVTPLYNPSVFITTLNCSGTYHSAFDCSADYIAYEMTALALQNDRSEVHCRMWRNDGKLVATVNTEFVLRFRSSDSAKAGTLVASGRTLAATV